MPLTFVSGCFPGWGRPQNCAASADGGAAAGGIEYGKGKNKSHVSDGIGSVGGDPADDEHHRIGHDPAARTVRVHYDGTSGRGRYDAGSAGWGRPGGRDGLHQLLHRHQDRVQHPVPGRLYRRCGGGAELCE